MRNERATHIGPFLPMNEQRLEGPEGIARATTAARRALVAWSNQPIKERLRLLDAFRRELVASVDRCVEVVGRECDKTEADVVGEVFQVANLIGFLVKNAPSILRPRRRSTFPFLHKRAWVQHVPLGVVGVISPWNYPIVLPAAAALQALGAGNTVVQKPSEHATESARLLLDIWRRAGGPEDVWLMAEGGPETGAALAGAKIDKVFFTGGAAGGKAVLRAAAESMTPAVMELGGSDAMLVCPDANLIRASEGAVWGAFYNAGQSCIGVRRCFVHEAVVDQFAAEVARRASQLTVYRDGAGQAPDYGMIRTQGQIDRLRTAVDDAIANGAELGFGGTAPINGRFVSPTVLRRVRPGMRVMTEELFAPILSIIPVGSMDEAVQLANDSAHGLGASVWSRDRRAARALATRLHAGGVAINDCLVHFAIPSLPFGGVKESGFGRSHGEEGLKEFCAAKAFVEDRFGLSRELYWFSAKQRSSILRRLLGVMHPRSLGQAAASLLGLARRGP